jgi:hypothetical protein
MRPLRPKTRHLPHGVRGAVLRANSPAHTTLQRYLKLAARRMKPRGALSALDLPASLRE